jgi:hypothetical protein
MAKLLTDVQSCKISKVAVLLGVSMSHALNMPQSTSHIYRLLHPYPSKCTVFSISTVVSTESHDFQTFHWPTGVEQNRLCILIAISTLASTAETQSRVTCSMHTVLVCCCLENSIVISQTSCCETIGMHGVHENQGSVH